MFASWSRRAFALWARWRLDNAACRSFGLLGEALAKVVDDVGRLGHPSVAIGAGDTEYGHCRPSACCDERIKMRLVLVDVAVLDLDIEALKCVTHTRAKWAAIELIEREIG